MTAIINFNKEMFRRSGNCFMPTDNALKWAVKQLYERGEISLNDYGKCLRGWKNEM